MDDPQGNAKASWASAQKHRSDILAKINGLKDQESGNILADFQDLENKLAQLRLACISIVFFNFKYAITKNVENIQWQMHVLLNTEFRKATSRLTNRQVVIGRKLEKQYKAFLTTSDKFYFGYIGKLNERFDIPELHRVAHGLDIDTNTSNSLSNIPPALEALVLISCQSTLVHLGDLARYRFQISDKRPDKHPDKPSNKPHPAFEKAIDYYTLANSLDPNDGGPHNQLAVLYQIRREHLDSVYQFHRSLCVEKPHPLGMTNIKQKFTGLENPSSRMGRTVNSNDAMINWFLRLHAYFFQGEKFSQQAELETEVLHGMELAVKSDADEVVLRKMLFINIAAYDIALEKVLKKDLWSIQGSQSAQFLLRFNIRTVLMLLRLLKTELLDESPTFAAPDNGSQSTGNVESPLCFSKLLMRLLPLIRLYFSWIYVSRADCVKYQAFLVPYVNDVYRLLADTLTLLNGTIDNANKVTVSAKYLLPEDVEAIGLRPFNDEDLSLFIRPEELLLSKDDEARKPRKPRQRSSGFKHQPQTEAIWRVRDILYCGTLLAKDPTYPLALTLAKHNGRNIERWNNTDDTPSQTSMGEVGMSRMLNKLKFNTTAPSHINGTGPSQRSSGSSHTDHKPRDKGKAVARQASSSVHNIDPSPLEKGKSALRQPLSSPDDIDPTPVEKGKSVSRQLPSSPLDTNPKSQDKGKLVVKQEPSALFDTDAIMDSEMVDMVNKLVDVEDPRPRSSQLHADTSYGMNTTMARDIFGRLITNSAQPSPNTSQYYAPAPGRSGSRGQGGNVQLTHGDNYVPGYVPRSVQGQFDGMDSSLYLSDLITPTSHTHAHPDPAESATRGSQGISSYSHHRSKSSRDSLQMTRNSVVDAISSSLCAQHGLTPNRPGSFPSPSPGLHRAPATFQATYTPEMGSPRLHDSLGAFTANGMERSISQHTTASSPRTFGAIGSGRQSGQNSGHVSRLSDIMRDSTFDDDDVEMGSSGLKSQSATGARDKCRNKAPGPPSSMKLPREPTLSDAWTQGTQESLTFSHPSSLYGGTPARIPAPRSGPSHTAFSNGNYNASPAFGGLGPDYNARADPATFVNSPRSYVGDSTFDAYQGKANKK